MGRDLGLEAVVRAVAALAFGIASAASAQQPDPELAPLRPGVRVCRAASVPHFTVGLERRGGWPDAHYRIDVSADGEFARLEFDFPYGCAGVQRSGSEDIGIFYVCDRETMMFFGMPNAVNFTSASPRQVEVEVWQDGRMLGRGDYTPTYDIDLSQFCKSPGAEPALLDLG